MYQKKKYIKGPLRGPCCIGSSTELLAYQQGEGAQSVFLRGSVRSFRFFEGFGFSACSEGSGESLGAPVHVRFFGLRKGYIPVSPWRVAQGGSGLVSSNTSNFCGFTKTHFADMYSRII